MDHQKKMASDFKERFFNLKQITFPTCMKQLVLLDIANVLMQHQEKLSEMQYDESGKTSFNIK